MLFQLRQISLWICAFLRKNSALEHETRINNISDLSKALTRSGIKHYSGKTLLGFTVYRGFHPIDDDIAIDIKDLEIFCKNVIPELIGQGFRLIRVSSDDSMISMERNKRYVDICIFRYIRNSTFYGYGKYYPSVYYSRKCLYSISPECSIDAPQGSLEICNLKYPKLCNYRLNTFIIWEHGLSRIQDINHTLSRSNKDIMQIEEKHVAINREDLSDFLEIIYCKEKHSSHIYEKCRLLLQVARLRDQNLYRFSIVKFAYREHDINVLNSKEIDEKSRKLFNDMKWTVREQFNPRFGGHMQNIKLPNTSPGISHCHVIHSTDTIGEIILIDQLVAKYSITLAVHNRLANVMS